MKSNLFRVAAVAVLTFFCSCEQQKRPVDGASSATINAASDSAMVKGNVCNRILSDIRFTKSVNNADSLIQIQQNGAIKFSVGEKKDYFCDPNDGKLSNKSAPILLQKSTIKKRLPLSLKLRLVLKARAYITLVFYTFMFMTTFGKSCALNRMSVETIAWFPFVPLVHPTIIIMM